MKTIIILVIAIAVTAAGFIYRREIANALEMLKRPTAQEVQIPPQTDAVVATNSTLIAAPVLTTPTNRLNVIVGKMATALVQLDNSANVSAPPVAVPQTEQRTPSPPSEDASVRYTRLWDKLQRNQKAIDQ